ncbi:glycosyltransferase family 2 protein [Myxococcus sp. K15C18031901]|uniref:glycosyltransferase family 2 protein n=1 Tax=Myxococcus dinghuensis TaxID=2906761 RepID=UPI0020A74A7C|nr:glycosyltransferase family A protein [Myxococcus dinghuensis]MCP3103073.1 glycosyltransferase family 2 protein [Myxococcus dinghuensis]
MPFFSVVIPTYNRARLLERTLASVFAQEEKDYEVLVVDDGSTDDTLEMLARMGDRVRVLRQRNAGPGAARNLGIEAARGEYVVFLDSDDLWFPWTLAVYRQVLRELGQPTVVMGTAESFHDETTLSSVTREPVRVVRFHDYLASAADRTPRTACVLAVRAEALRRVEGFTPLRVLSEDHDLLFRLGTEPGFAWVRAPVVVGYRKHGGSESTMLEAGHQGISYQLMQERLGRYPGGEARRGERLDMLLYNARHVSHWLVSHQRWDLALDLYWRGLPFHRRLPRWRYMLGFLPRMAVLFAVNQVRGR